jgi:tRNA nucleotidyltransferase (CCA-adding enzyme)
MRDTLRLKAGLYLLDKSSLKPSDIYYLVHEYDSLAIQASAIASDSPIVRRNLGLFLAKLRYLKPALDGEELKGLGIPAGPEMGRVIQLLHKAKLDGQVTTRADEMKLARSMSPELER